MSLDRVMIYKKSGRVLKAACWSCGRSDTYCDGLLSQREQFCCDDCRYADHDPHVGL